MWLLLSTCYISWIVSYDLPQITYMELHTSGVQPQQKTTLYLLLEKDLKLCVLLVHVYIVFRFRI
jgi:hypothetical protein